VNYTKNKLTTIGSPKLEVISRTLASDGIKIDFNVGDNFQIVPTNNGPELIVTRFKSNSINSLEDLLEKLPEKTPEEIEEENIKTIESEEQIEELKEVREFKRKWQIKPGFWWLDTEKGLLPIEVVEELYFETRTSKKLLHILRTFIKNHTKMLKYKKLKRSYLLHSNPGMGKSALIRYFCKEALRVEGTCVIRVSGDVDFKQLQFIFSREYEKTIKCIVLIIEDFGKKDYTHNINLYNPTCLNFLDGNMELFRVPILMITTTNFAKELGHQLTNRPGRFNKIIKVLPPTDEEIYDLVEYHIGRPLNDDEKTAFTGKQFSPDYCLEVIIRSELEEVSMVEAADEIMKEREGIVDWENI
jgi:SpoVK/Ycf46/Vps4 family AAA+-type ATPase